MSTVLELLQKHSVGFTESGRDYLIKCLNPQHEDNNPSLHIDKLTGIGHCFSCGYKLNLFNHFEEVQNYHSVRIVQLQEKIKQIWHDLNGVEIPEDYVPMQRPFRGISTKTLSDFNAFSTSKYGLEDRICFPITDVSGKNIAILGRHTVSTAKPKYYIYPAHVQLPLYPIIAKPSKGIMILVEGIFDVLNLVDNGVSNVQCIFGVSTLKNNVKNKLAHLKLCGTSKIILLLDGDEAGKKAAIELKPLIEKEEFIVDIFDLPDNLDPGEMSSEQVEELKRIIYA